MLEWSSGNSHALLILDAMTDFMCDWATGFPETWSKQIWVCLRCRSFRWVNIWIGRLYKIALLKAGGPHPISWTIKQKELILSWIRAAWLVWDIGLLLPLDSNWDVRSSGLSSFLVFELGLTHLILLVPRPSVLDWNLIQFSWVSSLPTAYFRISQPP